VGEKLLRRPLELDRGLSDLAHQTSEQLGLPVGNSVTVAGHDAISMSRVYPTCLVFVPSRNGLSHNEAEFTSEQDLRNGLRLLTALLYRICAQPADSV
jgi:beta-ureidopropionase / N-carbamoyl-L-amino-acid hydrolase